MVKTHYEVKGRYIDSILLMQISRELEKNRGISSAGVMSATKENLAIFENLGFEFPDNIQSTSIIIAVDADTDENGKKAIEHALNMMDRQLSEISVRQHSLDEIGLMVEQDDFPILFISTPGEYVKDIALKGLEMDVNIQIFSSNVPLEIEKILKEKGREKRLLVMGPDAGTTIINGMGLGFSNAVRVGKIGVIGSSGTGVQELTVLLERGGLGVSAAIGVGTNDFSKEIDGTSARQAIDLMKDSSMLMVIAKKPDQKVKEDVIRLIRNKPSVFISLGDNESYTTAKTYVTGFIDEGVNFALKYFGKKELPEVSIELRHNFGNRKLLRGFFVGGSLCYQAQAILQNSGIKVYSNTPIGSESSLPSNWSKLNVCIDMGAEQYVKGKPHPMMDPEARNSMIVKESRRSEVAVILFDILLGYGSSMDPLAGLEAPRKGPELVASICGTLKDQQNFEQVKAELEKIGVKVFNSSCQAAKFTVKLMGGLS